MKEVDGRSRAIGAQSAVVDYAGNVGGGMSHPPGLYAGASHDVRRIMKSMTTMNAHASQ